MIVDGHAHVFPSLHGLNGYASKDVHMRSIQVHVIAPSQPVIETATGRVVTKNTVSDGKGLGWSNLLDIGFRVGPHGRFEWCKDGIGYHIQMFSPSFTDSVTPELLLAHMDHVGVDKAMLHNAHMYGMLNDHLAATVQKYPERLSAAAQIHEAECDKDEQIQEFVRAVEVLELKALHFQIEGLFVKDFCDSVDDEKFTPFWEEVRRLGIPVLWNVRPVALPLRASYIEQIGRLARWARRWPDIPSVFTHGVNVSLLSDANGRVTIPEELWSTLEADNMFLELLLPVMQGSRWDYPFPEGQRLIQELYRRLGGSKMLWGSDYPTVERTVTYRQSLDYIRRYCDFLSEADRERILGRNASEIFGLDG